MITFGVVYRKLFPRYFLLDISIQFYSRLHANREAPLVSTKKIFYSKSTYLIFWVWSGSTASNDSTADTKALTRCVPVINTLCLQLHI